MPEQQFIATCDGRQNPLASQEQLMQIELWVGDEKLRETNQCESFSRVWWWLRPWR